MTLTAALGAHAAEPDTNTLVVTASRIGEWRLDRAELYILYRSAPETGLDEVLARLPGLGLQADNLAAVETRKDHREDETYTAWTFRFTTPIDRLPAVQQALAGVRTQAGAGDGPPAMSYQVSGARWSNSLTDASACPWASLMDDARRQADSLAAAAGRRAGGVISLASDHITPDPLSASLIGVPVLGYEPAVVYTSPISASTQSLPMSGQMSVVASPSCLLTVQFRLLP